METLTLRSHSTDAALVLTVTGEIDLATQAQFEEAVTDALRRGPVVVDMSQVTFLGISGLRSLLICTQSATDLGQPLVFAAAPRAVRRLVSVARLRRHLPLSPSVRTASAGVGRVGRTVGLRSFSTG